MKLRLQHILLLLIIISVLYYIYRIHESFIGTAPNQPAIPCSPGYWCPASSSGSKDHACPGGTYGSASGLTLPSCSGPCKAGCVCDDGSITACPTPCPAGYFCVEGTGGSGTPPIMCPQGYYCPISSTAPIICPTGAFCPPGTTSAPTGSPTKAAT